MVNHEVALEMLRSTLPFFLAEKYQNSKDSMFHPLNIKSSQQQCPPIPSLFCDILQRKVIVKVLRQPIGPIFKGQAVLGNPLTKINIIDLASISDAKRL
jgi:hypothetical protein